MFYNILYIYTIGGAVPLTTQTPRRDGEKRGGRGSSPPTKGVELVEKNRHPKPLTDKSRTHGVREITTVNQTADTYAVTSGHTGREYTVTILAHGGAMCTCDWALYRPASNMGQCGCSHVIAVMAYREQSQDRRLAGVHTSRDAAKRNHRKVTDIGDGLYLATRQA
jgi:hypothetical protein